jgi:hypothetical protein
MLSLSRVCLRNRSVKLAHMPIDIQLHSFIRIICCIVMWALQVDTNGTVKRKPRVSLELFPGLCGTPHVKHAVL